MWIWSTINFLLVHKKQKANGPGGTSREIKFARTPNHRDLDGSKSSKWAITTGYVPYMPSDKCPPQGSYSFYCPCTLLTGINMDFFHPGIHDRLFTLLCAWESLWHEATILVRSWTSTALCGEAGSMILRKGLRLRVMTVGEIVEAVGWHITVIIARLLVVWSRVWCLLVMGEARVFRPLIIIRGHGHVSVLLIFLAGWERRFDVIWIDQVGTHDH